MTTLNITRTIFSSLSSAMAEIDAIRVNGNSPTRFMENWGAEVPREQGGMPLFVIKMEHSPAKVWKTDDGIHVVKETLPEYLIIRILQETTDPECDGHCVYGFYLYPGETRTPSWEEWDSETKPQFPMGEAEFQFPPIDTPASFFYEGEYREGFVVGRIPKEGDERCFYRSYRVVEAPSKEEAMRRYFEWQKATGLL